MEPLSAITENVLSTKIAQKKAIDLEYANLKLGKEGQANRLSAVSERSQNESREVENGEK